ncbi:MAG TPA: T9SS type A sorting domain-containing protein, partial [Draconibacterium sp.]|nr:T9SS type A sorting domain-containing protein [Draconibacterium sp.]
KSAEGGSWMALVAALNWKSFDLTTMKSFKFWIYSPVALPKSALPKFFFESHSGDPNKSGKLMLANYVATDLAANTWTEVNISLADVWAADVAFTAKDVVKGIFFEQNAADNIEHTLYLDEFYFTTDEVLPVVDELVLFENSASDRFHDQSWSTKAAPSTLVQEHWQEAGLPDGDKLPVVTSPVKSGPNALKMQWKSADGGSWMALVAALNWKSFDLTAMKTLKFWVYSPVDLAKTALPKFFLESHSGNPNKSGKLLLANYVDADLVANTWTEVNISLADVWAADAAFVAKDVVKGIFFEQNTADNVEHILYMDDFKFVSTTTGINRPVTKSEIHAYYSNGEIRISNYSGNVRVFDLVGRKVAEGPAYDGNFRVNLKSGIYIVNTTKGNTKIALQ